MRGAIRSVWRARSSLGFLVPLYVFFAAFTLLPLVVNIVTSFQKVGAGTRSFVGFGNYERMLGDPVFWKAMENTLVLTLLLVPLIMATGLAIAAVATQLAMRWQSFFRLAFYLPAVASAVVLSLIWLWLLNPSFGLLNYVLGLVGVGPVEWLGQTETALLSVLMVVFSFSMGAPVILFIAGLNAVPTELYEAARIDGASPVQEFFRISLPLLRPTIAFVLITTTIGTFQVFAVIQILTRGGPANATQTLVYRIYEKAFVSFDFGQAASLSVVLLLIALVTAYVQMRVIGRSVSY